MNSNLTNSFSIRSGLFAASLFLMAPFAFALDLPQALDFSVCDLELTDSENPESSLKVQDTEKKLFKVCKFEDHQSLNSDESFLIKKWGEQICSSLISEDVSFGLKCRYLRTLEQKVLNSAQAMALAGYTAEYYNYLTPQALALKPTDKGYEGFDIFNKVLRSTLEKLGQYPEFQYNHEVYRGTSFHGKTYAKSNPPEPFERWTSSSCTKEVAFGPELIEKPEDERKRIVAEELSAGGYEFEEEIPGLEFLIYDRDPKSIPPNQTGCQKTYYHENPTPPMTEDASFGSGDLRLTILPRSNGPSKRVAVYGFSKRSEAEILFPPDAKFIVKEIDETQFPTHITLEEVP